MIFTRQKKWTTWVEVFKKILRGGKACVTLEKERLKKLGMTEEGATWLLNTNLAALSYYFSPEERKKIQDILT